MIELLAQIESTSSDAGALMGFLVWGAIIGLIGMAMAKKRNRPLLLGFVLGFFLSFIGLIVLAIMGPAKGPPCSVCGTPLTLVDHQGTLLPARVCFACGAQQAGGVGAGIPPPPSIAVPKVIPTEGLQAWATPDPNGAVVAQLPGGLPVNVVEERGEWAHVAADNGWQGWVDARRLTAPPVPTAMAS